MVREICHDTVAREGRPLNPRYVSVRTPGPSSATSAALKAARMLFPMESYGMATDADFRHGFMD